LKDFNPVSSLLQRHIQRAEDPPAAPSTQSSLCSKWGHCAGRAAAFSHPILFRSGRLIVFTESPIWATEIRHHLAEIESALSEFNIEQIDIRTSPPFFAQKSPKVRQMVLSERNRKGLQLSAGSLSHQGLREAITKLAGHKTKGR